MATSPTTAQPQAQSQSTIDQQTTTPPADKALSPEQQAALKRAGEGDASSSAKLFGVIHRSQGQIANEDLAVLNALYVELRAMEGSPNANFTPEPNDPNDPTRAVVPDKNQAAMAPAYQQPASATPPGDSTANPPATPTTKPAA